MKFLRKFTKKKNSGGGGGGGVGLGGQGGCERRIEVFVKIKKKIYFFFFFWGGGGSVWGGGGIRVDVNEELSFFGKIHQKKFGEWGGNI